MSKDKDCKHGMKDESSGSNTFLSFMIAVALFVLLLIITTVIDAAIEDKKVYSETTVIDKTYTPEHYEKRFAHAGIPKNILVDDKWTVTFSGEPESIECVVSRVTFNGFEAGDKATIYYNKSFIYGTHKGCTLVKKAESLSLGRG